MVNAVIKVASSARPISLPLGKTVPAQWDMSGAVTEITMTTSLLDQPGKLEFSMIPTKRDDNVAQEGSNVVLEVNGKKIFDGYVFKHKRSDKDEVEYTAYDRIRYLQNKDTLIFENSSPNQIFRQICQISQLPYKIVNGSTKKTAPVVHDNKSYFEMIKAALEENLVEQNQYLFIRDNAGQLEMCDIAKMRTKLIVGDRSLLTGYEYTASIDEDTANYVKLLQENKSTGKRDAYVVYNSTNIYRWGRLMHVAKVDENLNSEQIKQRARQLLKLYNRKTRTLKLTAIGDPSIREGNGIVVDIADLVKENVAQQVYTVISKCTHKFTSEVHTMDLDMEVV